MPWVDVSDRLDDLLSRGLLIERSGDGVLAERIYRQAAERAVTLAEQSEVCLRLARALTLQAKLDESLACVTKGEHLAAHVEPDVRQRLLGEFLNQRVALCITTGEYQRGLQYAEQGVDVCSTPKVCGLLWQNLGTCQARLGLLDDAQHSFAVAIEAFNEAGFEFGRAVAAANAAALAKDRGQFERGMRLAQIAEDVGVRCGGLQAAFLAAQTRAECLVGLHRHQEAIAVAVTAMGQFRATQDRFRIAESELLLARIYAESGEPDTAAALYRRAQETALQIPNERLVDLATDGLVHTQ
jgi:tetratricopeptide (TPR) repeat protein